MLQLQHINKSFSSKTVFDDTQFIANPNELTILIGPSGAGKTTLFNIILNIENCEYSFNNEDISSLDKKGKEKFILDNISYASQKPTFIADLKMIDQIDLLKQIYSNDYDVSELIRLFELEQLLECYPNQLSGGEKSRFAFILALIKQAGIYMFDEPTSALDDIQASHIVAVLNDLKNKGNIVIISTHDHRLIEQGDKVYRIEDKKLNLLKTGERKLSQETENKENKIGKLTDVNHILSKMKKHHKLYNTLMRSLLALGIVIAMCGIEVGILVKYNFEQTINYNDTNLLIVSKSYKNSANYLDMDLAASLPFEEKDLNRLNEIDHIQNMYPFIYHSLLSQSAFKGKNKIEYKDIIEFEDSFMYFIELKLNDNTQVIDLSFDKGKSGTFSTYPEQVDITGKIMEEWNDEGIYINYDFYNDYVKPLIKSDKDKKDITIKMPINIPIYNTFGYTSNDGSLNAGINIVQPMKIKGVMKGNAIINTPYQTNYTFSVSNEFMQKYIDEYKVNDSHMCFTHIKMGKTICDEPVEKYFDDYDDMTAVHNRLGLYKPYKHKLYLIQVDSANNLNKVKKEIEKMGYGAYSKYIVEEQFETTQKNIQNTILLVSTITFAIILFMNILIKLNNKKEEKSFQWFFKEKGFTKKMIHKLNKERFMMNCFDMTCYVIVEFILMNLIMYITTNMYLFDVKMGIVGIILVFFTEYIIPMCLEYYYARRKKHVRV